MRRHQVHHPRPPTRRSRLRLPGLLLVATLTAGTLAGTGTASAAPAPATDVSRTGPSVPEVQPDIRPVRWQSGRLVQLGIKFPTAEGPFPAPFDRRYPGYLIGAVDADAPQTPGTVVGGPGGAFYLLPHDSVVDSRLGGFARRALIDGNWVVPSGKAPAGAVLTRPTPTPADLPAAQRVYADIPELAYALRIGRATIPLTSDAAVRLGLRLGWLELDDRIGFGGTAWVIDRTPPFDPGPPPGPPPA